MAVHSSLLLVSFTLLLTVNSVVPFPSSPLQTSWTKTEATTKPFRLVDDYEGSNFFPAFDFEAIADPTHGFVDYVSENEANKSGLIRVDGAHVYIGSDHTSIASSPGRKSVRLQSKKSYNEGLFVIDLTHMPVGCGCWPAFWLVGPKWPAGGEIDIIECVHNQSIVQTTLHTTDGCDMKHESLPFSGNWGKGTQGNNATNCFINAPNQYGNQGCSILGKHDSMGNPFNAHGGGVFATLWDPSVGIQVWYFPRDAIPSDLVKNQPAPSQWGEPYAAFQLGADCNHSHFSNMNIIFDLTFCGDWAGSVFAADCPGLGSSCNDFVAKNPSAFTEAYWDVNYVKVYQSA
eukprot:m.31634 g.31634  ORF g.31634 m.31634 type:complete len:345 (+) comp10701_c0_seq2:165-1199(+)